MTISRLDSNIVLVSLPRLHCKGQIFSSSLSQTFSDTADTSLNHEKTIYHGTAIKYLPALVTSDSV